MHLRKLITAIFSLYLIGGSFCTACIVQTEDEEKAPAPNAATIKGRIVQNINKTFQIELADLKPKLFQEVKLPEPPIPADWQKRTMEQRQQWIKNFESSEDGKKFLDERKKKIDSAAKFDIPLESSGNFVIYEVPHGKYGLRGRLEKKINEKQYVLEVFGQIDVSDKVEEVLLDPMMVSVTRLLRAKDDLPEFEVPTFDNKARINNKLLMSDSAKGKHILFSFWSMESPPSKDFAKLVQESYAAVSSEHGIQLVSICIGSEPKKALEFVKTARIRGWHGYVDSWDNSLVDEFGVRVLPALVLVDAQQKVIMSHFDFRREFQKQNSDLARIVTDAITGKYHPPAESTSASDNND